MTRGSEIARPRDSPSPITRTNTEMIISFHAGTFITRKVVNSRSRMLLCFSVFRVFP